MRVAIVGAGISGLTAAHYLQREHDVAVFETDSRPGGHAHTVDVREDDRSIAIDTGFIVFNTTTYPGFVQLLGELGVGWVDSNMSLSVSSAARNFEYSGTSFSTLFAQRRRLFSPRHWRMIADIFRFCREAAAWNGAEGEAPLREWLEAHGYSEGFIEDHLVPMVRALWSADAATAARFPVRFLVRFFENHGFLKLRDAPRWLTLPGGSRTYVDALLRAFRGKLRLGTAVRSLRRSPDQVSLELGGASRGIEHFDHVVIACHADQALRLLADPSELERSTLGAFPYQSNETVLHTDERIMPRLKRTWASWNVHLDAGAANHDHGSGGACVTYWMNRLQPLDARRNYFVTLNRSDLRPEHVLLRQTYAHPVFTVDGIAAQAHHDLLIDVQRTSFAGAYWRNGFHEDGVASALRVVERLRRSSQPATEAA